MSRFLALSIVLFLSGCAALNPGTPISKAMQSWVGHTEHEVILAWGAPQSEMPDGNGGKVLVYSEVQPYDVVPGPHHYITGGSTSSRMFYIDAKGIIYAWRWKGL